MYAITTEEINEDWGYAWDCLVDACYHDNELTAIIDKYEGLSEEKHIAVVNSLINHIFTEESIRLVAMWGFGDTPAKDQMHLDIKANLDKLKPYLEKYLT